MNTSISETRDLTTCFAIRRMVFIEEQGVSLVDELDENDANAIHFLARDGQTPIGTARIVLDGSIGKIGRVCVLKSHRGTGLGAALIMAALDRLRSEPGISAARLGAQAYALAFYKKLDFAVIGPEYQDAGIAHFDMERRL